MFHNNDINGPSKGCCIYLRIEILKHLILEFQSQFSLVPQNKTYFDIFHKSSYEAHDLGMTNQTSKSPPTIQALKLLES